MTEKLPGVCGGLGVRHTQAAILFLGVSVAFALRVNISVGIVAMTDNTTGPSVETVDWSLSQRGTILGSFFWGYVVTQVPAGMTSRLFGARVLLGVTMILNGITCILFPLAVKYGGFPTACFLRVLQGLGQGFLYPSSNTLMSKWAVRQERGRIYGFIFGGAQFGTVVMMVGGGYLASSTYSWPSIFYTSGVAGLAWGVLCLWLVADSPKEHRTISKEERNYIESNLTTTAESSEALQTPWSGIFSSVPFWSLLVCHFAQNWGYWTLLTLIPTYIAGVFHFDIKQNGFLSAVPYLAMWLCSLLFPALADYCLERGLLSFGASRKFWNSLALYGGAAALALLALLDLGTSGALALLTVAVGLNAATYAGYYLNHLDLSPNFAGTLMGITNCCANFASIVAPTLAGIIVVDEGDAGEWGTVFLITTAMFLFGETVFNVLGSGEIQAWNRGSGWREKGGTPGLGEGKA